MMKAIQLDPLILALIVIGSAMAWIPDPIVSTVGIIMSSLVASFFTYSFDRIENKYNNNPQEEEL